MIFDGIDQLNRYAVPKSSAILKFIATHDCANLPDGQMEIEGHDLFVRIMSYVPKPAEENRFEIHRLHADVQYIATGSEKMQTSRLEDLASLTEYDSKTDLQFFKPQGPISDAIVHQGHFAVFYPNEAHRPSCAYSNNPGVVKKLVFKIRMGL